MNKGIAEKIRINADYEKLSPKSRKNVADFITFLKVKEELEATEEIINDASFLSSIMKGEAEFESGQFKKWSEVKEDV
ncbi:MAG: hypothetical protein HQK92_04280 [Nitrospirae bacterium]|nr:hypothetical protein [Nitrospirota bacterium]